MAKIIEEMSQSQKDSKVKIKIKAIGDFALMEDDSFISVECLNTKDDDIYLCSDEI